MLELLSQPMPWYIAGPLIGLIVPMLLLIGNRQFGVSENLRHLCAMMPGKKAAFFDYDWKGGSWNLTLVAGTLIGAFIAATFLPASGPIDLSPAAIDTLQGLGITDVEGLAPAAIFSWDGLFTLRGFVMIVVGGFLVGFGTRYAGGCTSGHAISGLSDLQLPSLIAVIGFFAGGLLATFLLIPLLI